MALKGLDLDSLFAADLESERLEFRVGGQPAFLDLLPMDAAANTRFQALVAKVCDPVTGQMRADMDAGAMREYQLHLVAHTVIGGTLWRRTRTKEGEAVGWQQDVIPADARSRRTYFENCQSQPAFWEGLLEECLRVNGLGAADQGN